MTSATPAAGHTAGLIHSLDGRDHDDYGGYAILTEDERMMVADCNIYGQPAPKDAECRANARRLAACWNAMLDLTTEAIESLAPTDVENLLRNRVLAKRVEELEAEVAQLKASYAKEEAAALKLIDERDEAEEAISQAYYLVTGHSPEWSNYFEYPHALAGISEAVAVLKLAVKKPAPDADEIVRRVAELPDRTSPENWPEAMLVTADELRQIIVDVPAPAPSAEERP